MLPVAHAPLPNPLHARPPLPRPQTKQRVLTILSDLERASPFSPGAPGASESLLGDWSLVFASDGTVVTRTAPAQLLAQMAALPGVGLMDIQQQLENPAAGGGTRRRGAQGWLGGAGLKDRGCRATGG